MPPAQDGERCRRRAEHGNAVAARRCLAEIARSYVGVLRGVGAHDQGGESAVGRPAAGAAGSRLLLHKLGEVAAEERLHDGMLRAEGLQQDAARCLSTAGAAGDLVEELDGALRRPQVAAGEAQVSVNDANQRQVRKVPAFGDDLRADDKIDLAGRDGVRGCGGGVRAGKGVARHDEPAGGLEDLGGLLRDALDTGADRYEARLRGAGRAGRRDRLHVAAVVAGEQLAGAVLDEPGRTVRALHAVAARAAEGQRCVAAAVEEQHGLLAARQGVLHGIDERLGQEAPTLGRR